MDGRGGARKIQTLWQVLLRRRDAGATAHHARRGERALGAGLQVAGEPCHVAGRRAADRARRIAAANDAGPRLNNTILLYIPTSFDVL